MPSSSRSQARVTGEVARSLAELSRALAADGHDPEAAARFLMRCAFTMLAEGVGLRPAGRTRFREQLERSWLGHPAGFPGGVQAFWSGEQELRRLAGGRLAEATGLPLSRHALALLLDAARHDWSQVEPSIFGTLLERALDPKERHRLGAHYTPRAYVERLVRPTVEAPLRADWLVARAEARHLREAGKRRAAAEVLQQFHRRLCEIRVLDPACGSGNFLYVALDLVKQLEAEVREERWRLGDPDERREFHGTVRPSQFLGIEKKRWAKEIAELVLWIGYLRWHFRAKGERGEVPEPALEGGGNIEHRDAVLDWDGAPHARVVLDERGRPVTRWDGETTKIDPVTGTAVPDERATMTLHEYPNARRATWPAADFIVGNPPYVGNKRMRLVLGDGYVQALRSAYAHVPESADYVMYWWHHASERVLAGEARRFGLITTNSVTQTFNRRVVERQLSRGLGIVLAIPDHPWVDSESGAAVRIAMMAVARGERDGTLMRLTSEAERKDDGAAAVSFSVTSGPIAPTLQLAARLGELRPLAANEELAFRGITLVGRGFGLPSGSPLRASPLAVELAGARSILGSRPTKAVLDAFGLTEAELRTRHPQEHRHLLARVKPFRDAQERKAYRERWWTFAEPRVELRRATQGLARYIATIETSRHRWFTLLERGTLPEQTLIAIALDDPYALGVLSSRPHVVFARESSTSKNGAGNDPRYNIAECFERFPFPAASEAQEAVIRELALRLDAHRRRQLAAHPKLTITRVYNVLEKRRAGEELRDADRAIDEQGRVGQLARLHHELDAAVLAAYGWPAAVTDEALVRRLVALNAERSEEEAEGLVRWLRPDFQAPEAGQATNCAQRAAPDDPCLAGVPRDPVPPPPDLCSHG